MTQADTQPPRIAVIGAGPSGLYTAEALLAGDPRVTVDVIDRLPAPYGLVRYGVAPDHLKMKSVIRALVQTFDDDRVRFLGNVTVGEDGIPGDVLREYYHAVVYASGSSLDRDLGIEGEDLEGSVGSGAFVSWYCGHPDAVDLSPDLDRPGIVVVGAGNVALDVARVLARPAEDLVATDAHDEVWTPCAAARSPTCTWSSGAARSTSSSRRRSCVHSRSSTTSRSGCTTTACSPRASRSPTSAGCARTSSRSRPGPRTRPGRAGRAGSTCTSCGPRSGSWARTARSPPSRSCATRSSTAGSAPPTTPRRSRRGWWCARSATPASRSPGCRSTTTTAPSRTRRAA